MNQVDQRVTVRRGQRRRAAKLREGGAQVDVLHHVIVDHPRGHTRPDDDERHVDVGVEGRLLARHQRVLAHVIAVVGAEDRRRCSWSRPLAARLAHHVSDHPVDRLHRLDAQIEEAIDVVDLDGAERLVHLEPARRIGVGDVERRIGRQPRVVGIRDLAGAGVYGACGAKRGHLEDEGAAGGAWRSR